MSPHLRFTASALASPYHPMSLSSFFQSAIPAYRQAGAFRHPQSPKVSLEWDSEVQPYRRRASYRIRLGPVQVAISICVGQLEPLGGCP